MAEQELSLLLRTAFNLGLIVFGLALVVYACRR
jgi:hypothetical protein